MRVYYVVFFVQVVYNNNKCGFYFVFVLQFSDFIDNDVDRRDDDADKD